MTNTFKDVREELKQRIKTATLYPGYEGIPFADLLDYVAINCPACHQRIGIFLGFSEGVHEQQDAACELCGAEFKLTLRHAIPPIICVLIGEVKKP